LSTHAGYFKNSLLKLKFDPIQRKTEL
jgi:hypothetical protein